ncbi:Phospholipase D beta 1 [Capsicum annuum]|nr:Phospholipase D beta 1 [Capsicum annuum]
MDNYNNSPHPYPYNTGYGYPPNVPPPTNQPYPPPSTGAYPPPGAGGYPYPNQSPQYPPPYNTQHSGHYNYHGAPPSYPPAPSAPPAPALHHSSSFDYGYRPASHGAPTPYPPQPYPPPPTSTVPTHERQGSYGAPQHYQHSWPERPLESHPPPKVHDSHHHRQDSVSSFSSSDSFSRPSAYPPIHDLVANMNLSENHPSAPASHPAPASASFPSSPAYHVGQNPVPPNYNAQGNIYGHPNSSFSRWEAESAKPTYPTPCPEPQNAQAMQVVPFMPSKSSLKVLLLHGNLEIWVYEAKNLPNMDMFHKTIGDMFGQMSKKITSDPYVSINVAGATIGRTYVINNNENPVWMQHFNVPVAHHAAELQFLVKDDDIVGSQLMGTVSVPLEQIYGGGKVEGFFPILSSSGKPCKPGAVLRISVQYYPMDQLSTYNHGVGAGPEYYGVPGTYFPLRMGGTVTLYQDAHVPDGYLPNLMLDHGMQYVHGKCWHDIFDAIHQARRLIYITGWSVWHKVKLVRDDASAEKHTLGDLLKLKSQEGVRVLLLVWDDPTSRSFLGYKTDGVMATHDEETRSFFKHSSVKVLLCPRVAGKRHSWVKQREVGVIYTHHQKTVILDGDAGNNRRKIIAFVGGLDLCDGRYDTPEHPLFRTLQTVHSEDYHNPTYAGSTAGCPREPWHDLHSKIDGPAAYDVLRNFEERWLKASKPQGFRKLKTSFDDDLLRIERLPEILDISDAPSVSSDDPNGWHVQVD